MASRPSKENERNQEATVYIGNIDENVDEELVCCPAFDCIDHLPDSNYYLDIRTYASSWSFDISQPS